MCRNLHVLDTSHTQVTRANLPYEPRASNSKKSPERGAGRPFIVKGHMTRAHAVL